MGRPVGGVVLVPIVIGVVAVVVGAAVPLLLRRRGDRAALAAARERARAVHHRLGFCVETLAAGEAGEALRLAEERWHTAGALLADADTVAACGVAGEVAAEGLRHVETACGESGIDLPERA